ncbi:hypothetical protein F442_00313, partial [Phytophthora nicotianae P10297]
HELDANIVGFVHARVQEPDSTELPTRIDEMVVVSVLHESSFLKKPEFMTHIA